MGKTEADLHFTYSVMGANMWLGMTNGFMHLFNIVKYFKEQEINLFFLKKGSLANDYPVRKDGNIYERTGKLSKENGFFL